VIVAYALGDGLGHLTRLRAARYTLRRDREPLTVLTASRFAADPRVLAGASAVRVPAELLDAPADLRGWIGDALAELAPDELWVDAFPAGQRGELDAGILPPGVHTVHLARLLRWPAYAELMPATPMRFDRTYLLEPLADEHRHTLDALSERVDELALDDPPATVDLAALAKLEERPRPRWLIAHAGPPEEVDELVAYAVDMARAEEVEPSLVVAAPAPPPVEWLPSIDAYPVWPLLPYVDRLVTAAGFNAMRQARRHALGDRHRFLPLPRRWDDQFARARHARRALD
jgi:hypothetical protein